MPFGFAGTGDPAFLFGGGWGTGEPAFRNLDCLGGGAEVGCPSCQPLYVRGGWASSLDVPLEAISVSS